MAAENYHTGNTGLNPPDAMQANAVPKVNWPGAFGLFKYSKAAVKVNMMAILVIYLLQFVLSTSIDLILNEPIVTIVQMVAWVFIQAALVMTYLAGARGQKVTAGEKISQSPQFFIKLLLLQLLVGLSVLVGLVLFILPGLILFTRLFVAEYYLVDKNMSVIEAYKASFAATKGHTSKVLGIIGVMIAMALISITIIGIPVTIYLLFMYSAATVLLYQYVSSGSLGPQEGANIQAPAQTPMTPPDTASNFAFNQPAQTATPQAPQQPQAQPMQSPPQSQPTPQQTPPQYAAPQAPQVVQPQQSTANNPNIQPASSQAPVDPQNPQT